MKNHIHGVEHSSFNGYSLFYISDFSDELKSAIRSCLSSVCHGAAKATTGRPMYCYKTTLKEFVRRYNDKPAKIRKGMIGELLLHVLLTEFLDDYQINSPFFNLEERSIKKGFDVVLNKKGTHDIWLAEVKSGECPVNKTSSQTAVSLINDAKNDLDKRLNGESLSLWMNAIHDAQIAIDDARDEKAAIVSILEDIGDNASADNVSSADINAILVATLFNNITDRITPQKIEAKHLSVSNSQIFHDVYLIAIQKETYEAVYAFIESESQQ